MLTLEDIGQGFRDILSENDQIVILHCGLWSFGHRLRPFNEDTVLRLIDTIVDAIGPKRTLVVPGYTYMDFPRSGHFDLVRSKPETGMLAEMMLKRPSATRSHHPMNSYFVDGPLADEILATKGQTAWGEDSLMGYYNRNKALFVTLGEEWHKTCSYYHHAEELSRVPYRYFKRFVGHVFDDGEKIGTVDESLFVNAWDVPVEGDYSGPDEVLRERRLTRRATGLDIQLEAAAVDDIVTVLREILADDPYYLVVNKDAVKSWVRDGKAKEIAGLSETQRHPFNEDLPT